MKYGGTWEPLRKVETFMGRNMQNMIILWTVVLIKYSYLFQTATTISHKLHILFKIYQSPFKVPKCNTQHRNRVTDVITKLRVLPRHLLLTLEWYRGTLKPLNKVLHSQPEDLVENNLWNWCFNFSCLYTCWIASVVSDSLQPHGLRPSGSSRHGWDPPGKNIGVGCHDLLQGIFPTQGWNPGLLNLLHWQADSLPLVPPEVKKWSEVAQSCLTLRPNGLQLPRLPCP